MAIIDVDTPIDSKRYVRHVEAGQVYLEHRRTKQVFWYDAAHADRTVAWVAKYLKFTKGKFYGKPFIPEPWQADEWFKPLFGWKRVTPGMSRKAWTRRFRRGRQWVPRKNGKTEELAAAGHLLLNADGEQGAEVYSHAFDKAQASLVFQVAQIMAMQSPQLMQGLELLKTTIYCPRYNANFRPLSGKPEGKHGLNPHGSLGDEAHEWESMDLHTFICQGMGARTQPLDLVISTAGKGGTVGAKFYEECQQIQAGVIDDPATLVCIYAADVKDDWRDPATWAKANPNLGVSVSHEYMADQAQQAVQSPRLENDFLRYHLNIWTSQDVRWLPMVDWRACDRSDDGDLFRWRRLFDELRGRQCWGGLDLASIQDLSALCWYFPACPHDDVPVFLWRFWCPRDTVAKRTKTDKVPYDQWTSESIGAITATEGNITDYSVIRRDILEDLTRFDVQGLGVDRFNSSQMIVDMMAEGVPCKWYPQNMMSMSPPSKALERMVLSHGMDHAGHPVAQWMAANVALHRDHNDNMMPSKVRSGLSACHLSPPRKT
jgi:phage terminase large subunit-like protein